MTIPVKEIVVETGLPFEPTIRIIEQSLLQMGATITKKNVERGTFQAQTGVSWKSWGVKILVSTTKNIGKCSVRVEGEPLVNTAITFTDSGATSQAINSFVQFLTDNVSRVMPEMQKKISNGQMCPTCGRELLAGTQFCPNDGTRILKQCGNCGHLNPITTNFCMNCGAAVWGPSS